MDRNEKWQSLRPNPKVCDHEDLCKDKKQKHGNTVTASIPFSLISDCVTGAASCADANGRQRSRAAAGLHEGDGGAGEEGRGRPLCGCYGVQIEPTAASTQSVVATLFWQVPNLKRGHIEDCGHWTQMDRPTETNEILVSWLREVHAKEAGGVTPKL